MPGLEAPAAYELADVQRWFHERVPDARIVAFDAYCDPDTRVMENVRVVVGFDAPKRVKPTNEFLVWLQEVAGKPRLEPHFEVPALLDALARGMGKAGFHTVVRTVVDGQTVFESGKGKELKAAVLLAAEDAHRRTRCSEASVLAVADEVAEDCKALLAVRSTPKKPLEVEISFEGEVSEDEVLRLLGYVREQLPARLT